MIQSDEQQSHVFDRDTLSEGARLCGVDLDTAALDRFERYYQILSDRNSRFNLTALKTERDIIIKHFIDSLSIFRMTADILEECAAVLRRTGGLKSVIDIGSGAGFPSVPLKIAADCLQLPWDFTAVESTGKKARFIQEASEYLGFANFHAICARAEDLAADPSYREMYAVCVSRAVAPLPVLIEYCMPFVFPGGSMLAMKGAREKAQHEVRESEKALSELGGRIKSVSDVVLPYTDHERTVVSIRKFRQTSKVYPRKSGIPSKKPLK